MVFALLTESSPQFFIVLPQGTDLLVQMVVPCMLVRVATLAAIIWMNPMFARGAWRIGTCHRQSHGVPESVMDLCFTQPPSARAQAQAVAAQIRAAISVRKSISVSKRRAA